MFDRLVRWARASLSPASIIARVIPTWMAARPLPHMQDTRKLIDEGYRKHALIKACIDEVATSAAEAVPRVGRVLPDGTMEPLPNHPLQRLLDAPNPDQSPFEFIETVLIHLESAGNFYVHKAKNRSGVTVQMWPLRPDRIKIKPDLDGMVELYEYTFEGGMHPQRVDAADVIHGRLPDPLDDYYGLSPIQAAARWGDLDQGAADYLRAYFLNAGAPSGLLKFKQRVEREERERVQTLWRERHGGPSGWHNVSVLDADVDYQPMGGAPERLRLNFIFDQTETRLCMLWGCPPIVVGAAIGLNRSTFANYKEARASFWEETLAPLYKRLGGILTRGFADEYPDVVVYFDLSQVAALQDDQELERRFGLDAWTADICTRDEARAMAGLPKDPLRGSEYKSDSAPASGFGGFGADPFAALGFARAVLGNGHGTGHADELRALAGRIEQLQRALFEHHAPVLVQAAPIAALPAPPVELHVRVEGQVTPESVRVIAEETARVLGPMFVEPLQRLSQPRTHRFHHDPHGRLIDAVSETTPPEPVA